MSVQIYRMISITMAVIFFTVGLIFLFIPANVFGFFNYLSDYLGMKTSISNVDQVYLILAVSYMYVVSLLAFFMFKNPTKGIFSLLLSHAKLSSSFVSLYFIFTRGIYLIYIVNFILDGLIGLLAIYLYNRREWIK